MGYSAYDIPALARTLDLLVELEKKLGHRLSLDAVATASLGVGKPPTASTPSVGGARANSWILPNIAAST